MSLYALFHYGISPISHSAASAECSEKPSDLATAVGSDEARNLDPGFRRPQHGEGMFVDQADILFVLHNDAEAVEASDIPDEGLARQQKYFNLNPGFSHLVEKLILNVEMCFRHFPLPQYR
jgi:hypothetical protein